jgi:hypothetical protein
MDNRLQEIFDKYNVTEKNNSIGNLKKLKKTFVVTAVNALTKSLKQIIATIIILPKPNQLRGS